MIKINFLSWREYAQKRKRRNVIYSVVLSLLLVLMIALGIYYKSKNQIQIQHEFRLIGTILNKQKHWGLILLPNNQVIKVQPGDLIGKEQAKIHKITSTEIQLLINGKLHTISCGSRNRLLSSRGLTAESRKI